MRVEAALLFVALVWGATFVLVKEALDDISTLLFLALRFLLAAAALAAIFGKQIREGLCLPNLRFTLTGGILAGLCLFAGYVLQTFGLKYTSAAKTGFLTGLYIPLVPFLGAILHRKFPRVVEVFGVSCAFAGMAFMTVQHDLLSISLGDALVASCAVAYACHILVLGHFAAQAHTAILIFTQIATCAVLASSTFWWAEPPRVRWSPAVWMAIGVTSLLATALAFAIQTWAQRYTTPTRTALIFSMEPVFACATSYLLLGERLTGRAISGAALILFGILLVEWKPAAATDAGSAEHII